MYEAADALLRILTAYWVSQATYVAAKLGVADLITDGVQTAEDLARQTHSDAASLTRILRFLARNGILTEREAGHFGLTDVGELLRTGVPGSLRDLAIFYGEEAYVVWGRLVDAVKSGQDAFTHAFGQGLFEYLSDRHDRSAAFNAAMAAGSTFFAAIPAAYDLAKCTTIVDVGGGSGALITALLNSDPDLRGVVADRPHVADAARAALDAAGLSDRCDIAPCDFFEGVPAAGDTYVLSRVLHDWNDERSLAILRNIRAVVPADGRLVVVERIIPDEPRPSLAIGFDLQMLVMAPGGRERTLGEYDDLFDQSGFKRSSVVALPLEVSLIEATPV